MRKPILILSLLLFLSFYTKAQVHPHALGIRFAGDGHYSGAELSYQHGAGAGNRFEFDLGLGGYQHYNNMFLSGTYQWDWNLTGGLNWYVGPGAALGFYNWDDGKTKSNGVNIGLGGQIGLEFDFNKMGAPLLLSLDARPMFDFIGYDNRWGWGTALGLRYTW